MNVDDRLCDLREATKGQVRPSPELLSRIEASLDRPAWAGWPRSMALAGAMAAVVLAIGLGRGEDTQRVASRPPTRAEFVARADQRCQAFAERRDRVQVLFPTPQAYALAADNLVDVLTRAIEDTLTVGAPPDAHDLLDDTLAGLRQALAQAERAKELAAHADTDGAAAALGEVDAIQGRVGNALADYGATQCRQVPR